MAYDKQNFTAGSILTASQMNKIDSSLYDVTDGVTAAVITDGTILSNIVSNPLRKAFFVDVDTYVPADCPPKKSSSTGYIEVMSQREQLKSIVIWHTFEQSQSFVRSIYNGNWQTDWENTQPEQDEIIMSTNLTNGGTGDIQDGSCLKIENIVNISFSYYTKDDVLKEGTAFISMPYAFRPKADQHIAGVTAGYGKLNDLTVTTGGEIVLAHGDVPAERWLIGQCTYISNF